MDKLKKYMNKNDQELIKGETIFDPFDKGK
jgi:hypothetical protein